MQNRKTSLSTLSLVLVFAAACSRTNTDTSTPEPMGTTPTDQTTAGGDTATGTGAGAGTGATGTGTMGTGTGTGAGGSPQAAATPGTIESLPRGAEIEAPAEYKTSDDEIFGVLETINDEAIEQAELAKSWSKSQKVKKYAADMIDAHKSLKNQNEAVRDRIGLRSTDSRLSDDIENNSEQKVETLQQVPKGDPFDTSFVDVQVENYARWIDFIDTKLMPQAQMPDLRQRLSETRTLFENRMNQAKQLQQTLGKKKS